MENCDWFAGCGWTQVGAERIHQMQDPELGIQQPLMDYKRLGYSDNWINQRLKSIGKIYTTKLNKLKINNPEAFFYWWKTEELLSSK